MVLLGGGEVGVGCSGSSKGRSRRADALRFRVGAEPAAEVKGDGPELEGREESAASLAAERVILEEGEAAAARAPAAGVEAAVAVV